MTDLRKAPTNIRGIKNNNPGNIRVGETAWQGKVPLSQNTDRNSKTGKMEFEQFISVEYGLRALMKNAYTWIKRGDNTIRKLISRWAPPSDNNPTESYIAYVSKQTGFPAEQPFKVLDKDFFIKLAKAVAEKENYPHIAKKFIPHSAYEEAYRLMGSTSYTPVPEKKNESAS